LRPCRSARPGCLCDRSPQRPTRASQRVRKGSKPVLSKTLIVPKF
jgi:hypothetical protein